MQYSTVTLSDDNFDDEFERFCDSLGVRYGSDWKLYPVLPDGFQAHAPDDDTPYTVYARSTTKPGMGDDYDSPTLEGEIAVQFGNGYLSVHSAERI